MGIPNNVETLILRFRDGLASNSTITEHQSIINEKKHVWWGWWAKPQETIPVATFSSMCVKIKNGQPLCVYLFDSGTLSLYKAKCEGIEYKNDKEKFTPPANGEATPAYYRDNSYFAWFKFSEIEPCDSELLKKYTYVDVDEFYNDSLSPFQVFDSKVIFNTQDLHSQQRTIWFVRKKQADDKSHEITTFAYPEKVTLNVDGAFKVLPYVKFCGFQIYIFLKSTMPL